MTGALTVAAGARALALGTPLSPALLARLTRDSASEAMAAVAACPALRAEAAAVLPALRAQAQAAGDAGVARTISKLFALYPQPDRSEAEWAAWWEAYYEDLAEFPSAALAEACRAWRRRPDAEFFPKPGPLRALAREAARPLLTALARAERATRTPPPDPGPPLTPEQREALARELMAVAARFGASTPQSLSSVIPDGARAASGDPGPSSAPPR